MRLLGLFGDMGRGMENTGAGRGSFLEKSTCDNGHYRKKPENMEK